MGRRGNPDWTKVPASIRPAKATEFEVEVNRLGLSRENYVASEQLRKWCEENRNRCYIPEWLLKEWGLPVDVNAA
jgi:hypothetical protein